VTPRFVALVDDGYPDGEPTLIVRAFGASRVWRYRPFGDALPGIVAATARRLVVGASDGRQLLLDVGT
jgi:hypothetical protein